MNQALRIGILGGTFDPVHVGHVETALAARHALRLDRVLVMPTGVPPHRHEQPAASRFHRFAMAALAVNGQAGLAVSDLEIGASGPSYTFDTLTRLHATGLTGSQIFFITGADAFAEIETWSRYPDVLDMAHFVVVSRPGYPASNVPAALPALAGRFQDSATSGSGRFVTGPDASAKAEPAAVSSQLDILVVDTRTPDVSSTDIRRRLWSGSSIAGMVPEAVRTYIAQHQLYSAPPRPGNPADHLHEQS